MSINSARNSITFSTNVEDILRNRDVASSSVIGSAHFKHINSMFFFESKERDKALAQIGKKIAGKFNSVKPVSRSFSSINNLNTSKGFMDCVDEFFINAMDLKFEHVNGDISFVLILLSGDKKTTIAVNKTCQIDKIIPINLSNINKTAAIAHKISMLLCLPVKLSHTTINVHPDRLSEWTPKGDAIVGPAWKLAEKGITRPSATP